MKTYTIRPLEWGGSSPFFDHALGCDKGALFSWSDLGSPYYCIHATATGYRLDTCADCNPVESAYADTIAAAKELAWQDWLRRITPALDEIK